MDDTRITVRVSADRLAAHLQISESAPPVDVANGALVKCISDAGIPVSDTMRARLNEIARSFTEKPRAIVIEIARGVAPVAGTNARIEWCEGRDPKHAPEPVRDAAGTIDHYAQPRFVHIGEGDAIGMVIPDTAGNPGRNVLGASLPAKPGKKLAMTFDEDSIALDGQTITAKKSGVLMVSAGTLMVTDVIEIKGDIDFSTANVASEGAVSVRGGVRDRFVVNAKQNIQIGGLVEAASLIAGGDIVLSRGMAGRSTGTIKAKGGLTAGFLHACTVTLGGNLTIGRELNGCTTTLGGHVLGQSATLIGGTLEAGGSILLGTIGSPAEAATTIRIGGDPNNSARIAELRRELKALDTEIRDLNHNIKQIVSLGKLQSPADKEKLTESYFLLDESTKRREVCESELNTLTASAKTAKVVTINADRIIYPNVRIEAGDTTATITRAIKGPARIALVKADCLMVSIAGGPMRPIGEFAQIRAQAA